MSGMDIAPIVRAQDYTIIKHNEDVKTDIDQNNFNIARDRRESQQNTEVVNTSESRWNSKDPDAREKGSNEYYGDGGNSRRENTQKHVPNDKVVVKSPVGGGFDLKI